MIFLWSLHWGKQSIDKALQVNKCSATGKNNSGCAGAAAARYLPQLAVPDDAGPRLRRQYSNAANRGKPKRSSATRLGIIAPDKPQNVAVSSIGPLTRESLSAALSDV